MESALILPQQTLLFGSLPCVGKWVEGLLFCSVRGTVNCEFSITGAVDRHMGATEAVMSVTLPVGRRRDHM